MLWCSHGSTQKTLVGTCQYNLLTKILAQMGVVETCQHSFLIRALAWIGVVESCNWKALLTQPVQVDDINLRLEVEDSVLEERVQRPLFRIVIMGCRC